MKRSAAPVALRGQARCGSPRSTAQRGRAARRSVPRSIQRPLTQIAIRLTATPARCSSLALRTLIARTARMAVAYSRVQGLGGSRARTTSASLTRSVRATHRANAEPALRTGLPIPAFSRAIVGSTQTAAKAAIARRACSTNSASVRAPRCAVLIPLAHPALANAATAAVTATFVIPRRTPASTTATARTARATTILSRSAGPARHACPSREGFVRAPPCFEVTKCDGERQKSARCSRHTE